MKRLALLTLFLAGCRPDRVEQGRYACDPVTDRAVGSAQCPGQSRCGLEGFCHEVGDVSVPWRCEVPEDCEGGFQCGLSADGKLRECHDPAKPATWRCASDTDCSGGWVCGLNQSLIRECHDPAMPRPWPCESSRDCVAGWQCGLAKLGGKECHDPAKPEKWRCETSDDCLAGWQCGIGPLNVRECHDPAAPESWTCLAPSDCLGGWVCARNDSRTGRQCRNPAMPGITPCDTGADCVGGWVCGLASNRFQRECHDPQQPRPWACADDGDCVGGWRCGLDGLCLDPGAEALGTPGPVDAGEGSRLNPVQQAPIDVVAVSPRFLTSQAQDIPTLALLRAGRLQAITREPAGVVRSWDLGPTPATTVIAQGPRSYEYDSNTISFTRTDQNVVYTGGPQGVRAFTLLSDGGVRLQALQSRNTPLVGLPVTRMKHGIAVNTLDYPTLFGFSDAIDRYYAFDGPQSGLLRPIDGFGSWTLAPPLLDLDAISIPPMECVLLVNPEGLWISQYDNYGFEPFHSPQFGNAACSPVGQRIERLATFGAARAAIVSSAWDGGTTRVSVFDLSPTALNPVTYERCTSRQSLPCLPIDQIPFTLQLGPCQACPSGELLDFSTVDATPPAVETRCGSPDGGVSTFFRITATATNPCSTQVLLRSDGLFLEPNVRSPAQPSQGRVAFSSVAGQVWFGSSTLTTSALSLDRAARGVARKGTAPDDVVVLADGVVALPAPGLGLSALSRPELTAVAVNEPTWVIDGQSVMTLAGARSIDEGVPLALAPQPLPQPQTLQRVMRGAAVEAVVTAGNQLSSATVAPTGVGLLVPRVSVVNAVQSAALLGAADGGGAVEGYLVTATGVSFVRSESETRWRVQEVVLPAAFAPQEVWYSQGRARVGFSDGVVFSLPSRLRIANAVPGGAVEDYVQACGQQLALTSGGLLRLVAVAGSAIGQWEPVPLPAGFAPLGLFGGRAHAVGADLYVFSQTGETARLTLSPCP